MPSRPSSEPTGSSATQHGMENLEFGAVKALRAEAANPRTNPHRLIALTALHGDRGAHDSAAGWCRELVAANPSAPADLLDTLSRDMNDFAVRLNVAKNRSTRRDTLNRLANDRNAQVSAAARQRTGQPRMGHRGVIKVGQWWVDAQGRPVGKA